MRASRAFGRRQPETRVQIPAGAPLSEVNVPSAFKGVPHYNNVKDDIYNTERALQLLLNSLAKLEKKEDAELIKTFVKVLEAQGLSKRRVLKYVSHLKLVSKHLKVPFAKATRKDIEEFMAWVNSQDYSPQTVQGVIVVLRRFYQWLRAKPEEYEGRSNRNKFQKWRYRACDKALKLLAKKD